MKRLNNQGAAFTGLIIGTLGLFLIGSIGFGLWAYIGREDFKKNSDAKAAQAVEVAKIQLAQEKDAEFAEREKSPLKTYTSPAAQGSISFTFPKTWSGLVSESSQSGDPKPLDGYFYPNYLPSVTSTTIAYALRLELLTQAYDQVLSPFNNQASSGTVRVTAFRPDKVPSVVGVKIEGTLPNNKQGIMLVLPLRDKTIKLWTESTDFSADFNNSVIPSLSFVP
ncbi:MAG: hypothetical protein KIH63_005450 [Candidatus Saccharibacteria bacterium]|nr:hypothetical protein [Candidatus Saccharibacteria bacterium]